MAKFCEKIEESRRRMFIRNALLAAAGMALAGGGVIAYASAIEPAWIEINTIAVQLPRLHPAFRGYRIVHITDLHTDETWMTFERLAQIVDLVNAQKPDLIVITGDFVTKLLPSSAHALSALRRLQAVDGVCAVLGNHDVWHGPAAIRALLRDNCIRDLKNETYTVRRQDATLHIVGMDDIWTVSVTRPDMWSYEDTLKRLTDELPATGAAVLLVHEPDFADVATANGRFDLQLSGHSHGGQVRLPFVGPIQVPLLAYKYRAGMYRTKNLQHYTNRGLGMVGPPHIRLNCRPEIAVFVCQPA